MIEGLEELDISENDILFIPPAISKLPNLTSLVISKNCEWVWSVKGEGCEP